MKEREGKGRKRKEKNEWHFSKYCAQYRYFNKQKRKKQKTKKNIGFILYYTVIDTLMEISFLVPQERVE